MKKCPKCGEEAGIPILYGDSPNSDEVDEFAQEKGAAQVWLGGNYFNEYLPGWHCTGCGHDWGRSNYVCPDRMYMEDEKPSTECNRPEEIRKHNF
jgi:hypothetical protein